MTRKRRISRFRVARLSRLLRFFGPGSNTILLVLAVVLGVSTAGAVWLFRRAIDFFHLFFREWFAQDVVGFLGDFGPVAALGLAGLLVGWIVQRFVGHERYHGVAGIMEAVALSGGHLRYRIIAFKSLASAISLGAGASAGTEDPSAQIGSNLGSMIGQRLHLSEEQVRLLVSAGAASAIAAAFNAPIAGVFFALEVVLRGELAAASVGVVVLCSVISAAVTQGLGIGEAAMGPFDFTLGSALEVPFFIPLALLLGPFAAGFTRLMYIQMDFWNAIKWLPRPVKTALGGVLVGLVVMFLPQIAGAGREFMNEVLNGEINQAATLLLLLAVAKLVMTTISVAAGFVGGTFTPSLFIGLLVGMAYGEVLHGLVGPVVGDPRSYAVAGMAGMMAGVVRAPLTGILLAFEVTNDYRFILPIMLVAVVCVFITERFMKYGVYEFSLVRQGIRLPEGRDVDLMQGITVGEVMFSPAPSIHESASLVELRDTLRAYHRHALCVIDGKGRLTGIVSLSDLQAAYGSGGASPDLTVGDIATRDVVTTRPQEALWTAIRNMGAREVGRLPVVDPTSGELVGIVNRHDIINGYNTVVKRKLHDQQVAEQVRLNTLVGAHVYELAVPGHAPITNKQIKEIPWPPEAVVASIHRKGKMVVPHGKTTIWPGDVLMVVADPHSEIALMELFGHKNPLA